MTAVRIRLTLAALCLVLPFASTASAQVLGTFPWQMQPYCNVVTMTLTSSPAGYTLSGTDDQCNASNKGSVVGVASFNAVGLVTLNFSIVTAPAAKAVHVSAIVSPGTGDGTWTDSSGNSGTFKFFGSAPGLPARPLSGNAAFVFQVTAANVCSTGSGYAVIDHPATNNDPRAIVLLTPNATWPGSGTSGAYFGGFNSQYEVSYWNNPNCAVQIPAGQGRWLIRRLDGANIAVNTKFSVMVFTQ